MRSALPALALLAVSTLALGWLTFRPAAGGAPVIAFFSPAWTAEQTLAAAVRSGARLVADGTVPFSLVLQSNAPNFPEQLHRAGAWLVLDATARAGCTALQNSAKG